MHTANIACYFSAEKDRLELSLILKELYFWIRVPTVVSSLTLFSVKSAIEAEYDTEDQATGS